MILQKSNSKRTILLTFISLGAALFFITKPIFAQTQSNTNVKGQIDETAITNDFDEDVKQAKDELNRDPEAQRHQKEVVDNEDEEAGQGDGQNNQEGINEYGDLQQAEDNQEVGAEDQDINNSSVDEVDDADSLDEESEEVINEHEGQEEDEETVENDRQSEQEASNANYNQEEKSQAEQNQTETPDSNE